MGTSTLQDVKLSAILEICDYLTSVISPSYKSNGSAALIISDLGEVCMTKSGIKVLNEMHCFHPLTKLIVTSVKKYHTQVGDGTKTFLILLQKIFAVIAKDTLLKENEKDYRLKSIRQILLLLNSIPMLFKKLRNSANVDSLLLLEGENNEKHLKQIMNSYFSTKFSRSTADYFSTLISQFITKSTKNNGNFIESLRYLNHYFPLLISKITSIEPSRIIEGFVFSKIVQMSLMLDQECEFVVLENLTDSDNFKNTILEVNTNLSVSQLITFYSKMYIKFVNCAKARRIFLILTSEMMNDELKYILQKHRIVFLDGILEEELNFFCSHFNIIPVSIWDFEFCENNVGYASSVKTVILGKNTYLQIYVEAPANRIPLHHVVICSPVKSQSDEYFSEICNCMKLLSLIAFTDLNISSNNMAKPSEIGRTIGMACPFPTWVKLLNSLLVSAPECRSSPFCLKISLALENIMKEKFTKSSFESDLSFLEPVARHEILFCNVLYLVIQLLKLDSMICIQRITSKD